jgi:hypothetical protein
MYKIIVICLFNRRKIEGNVNFHFFAFCNKYEYIFIYFMKLVTDCLKYTFTRNVLFNIQYILYLLPIYYVYGAGIAQSV